MANHVVHRIDDRTHGCEVCGVSWSYLNERDILMLMTQGKCIGRVERWHRCKLTPGMWCLGGPAHFRCEPLESSDAFRLSDMVIQPLPNGISGPSTPH